MKRSDAIELLVLNSKYSKSDVENFMELLDMAVGMLPPFVEPEKWSVMRDEKKYTVYYKWEPEDET